MSNLLPGLELTDCTAATDKVKYNVTAAVHCKDLSGVLTRLPLVMQFTNSDSARAWVAEEQKGIPEDGNCEAGDPNRGRWTIDRVQQGYFACYWSGGLFRMAWSYDDSTIGIAAEADRPAALYRWWQGLPNPS